MVDELRSIYNVPPLGRHSAAEDIPMTTELDRVMPQWEFREHHEIDVDATPEEIFAAIRAVRARDIRFFTTLVAIRRGFRDCPESILNPAKDAPIIDVALRTGFRVMADASPRELVIGMNVIPPARAIAAMNFLVEPRGTGCRVITETRVHATDAAARRRFALYWFVIRPGSGLIRRMWLAAIKRRAERRAS